jgi:hypothetical protein
MGRRKKIKKPLVILPGSKVSPTVLLHSTLQDADEIKSIVIIRTHKDGSICTTWSTQPIIEVAAKAVVFHGVAYDQFNRDTETIEIP